MSLTTAVLVLGLVGPGPLDAFRANYASINVEIEYVHSHGRGDAAAIAGGALWRRQGVDFVTHPDLDVAGRWECDGSVEHYVFSSPAEVIREAREQPRVVVNGSAASGMQTAMGGKFYVPRTEALFDGDVLASHQDIVDPQSYFRSDTIDVWRGGQSGRLADSGSPFFWWGDRYPFPRILRAHYSGVVPTRRESVRDGHPVEVEVYRKLMDHPEGWIQTEVAYDPAVGYLPRHSRLISSTGGDTTRVKEFYLVEARACAAGGFVPTEWYVASIGIEDFERKYPDYGDETNLTPSSGRLALEHFVAISFKDRSGPVAMTHLGGIRTIATEGGRVPLAPGTHSLTLDAIKSRLGSRLTNPLPKPALPSLDVAELRAFAAPPAPDRTSYLFGIVILAVAVSVAIFLRRRRLRALAALIGLIAVSGCGAASDPVVKLTGAFREPHKLYNAGSPALPMTFVVRNEGNRAIRLLKADGGCTCRRVDQSPLPTSLEPAGSLALEVRLSTDRLATRQGVVFQFETDRGPMSVPAEFYALPRHQLDPESRSHIALTEDEDWTFDLVHRAIYRSDDEPGPEAELLVPPELIAEVGRTDRGLVDMVPEFTYRDTTYRLSLKDRTLGLHKAVVTLRGPDHLSSVEAPIIWRRVPFLSSTPDRVTVGERPVRVFLRCPDGSVELTKVLSAPTGIKAVVSSTRELTVRPADDAPGVIDGSIEVGTTAEGRPPLRIPVVRYAPLAQK